jgi:hypothetical protein
MTPCQMYVSELKKKKKTTESLSKRNRGLVSGQIYKKKNDFVRVPILFLLFFFFNEKACRLSTTITCLLNILTKSVTDTNNVYYLFYQC